MFGCPWWAGVKIDWEEAWGSSPGDVWWCWCCVMMMSDGWLVMDDWWWWWVISDSGRWLVMVMGDSVEWCSIQSHMSFLSHFYEAIAISDESEIRVIYLGILLHLCKNVPSVQRREGEPILFLGACSLLGIALSCQETTVIKTNCPTKLMF